MIESIYKTKDSIQSIEAIKNGVCQRCFGNNLHKDKFNNYHCLDCYKYSDINETMRLYRRNRIMISKIHILNLLYNLTEEQKKGSNFFVNCFNNNNPGFLQAVCGAGKTEMTYSVILKALNQGLSIAFIIPRVEVLKEVYNRFIRCFPKTNIKILYENNKDFEFADIIFSTPQQLIYFFQEFDLLILDEVDAFPFVNNIFLERLVMKSVKTDGVILYMSATINNKYLQLINQNKLKYFSIASRYHFRDLSIPKFIQYNNHKQMLKILKQFLKIRLELNRQCIIFVPSINFGHIIKEWLLELQDKTFFISSKTKYKKSIVKEFRRGDFLFLVATTVLERGVTFSNIDCVVINSDHEVFSKESLIQISGRVGRVVGYENGEVIFLSKYLSTSMKQCKKEIVNMNERKNNEVQTM
ncbi:MAG: DEAD/DEAH box helicase family protein [Tenericutes bacterium]|nr:DEAD/DEAH box helicase family protein [Mycoplasmatota bacterium]